MGDAKHFIVCTLKLSANPFIDKHDVTTKLSSSRDCNGRKRKEIRRKDMQTLKNKCAGCNKRIRSRYLIIALEKTWHEKCLKCDCCKEILYSFENPCLYHKGDQKLCRLDYLRSQEFCGVCQVCGNGITPAEETLYEKNSYHQDCFRCIICHLKFKQADFIGMRRTDELYCWLHYEKKIPESCMRKTEGCTHKDVGSTNTNFLSFLSFLQNE
ncbi:LIM domain only protein 3-like [Hydractinia symbiolongicarpus]|uniref:LIM domain only protein 3-like n=1 Tax=Hydractinia symbiolongicarpus TaxID=13093 RepID=UPI0025505738|nr:LIM domain only protein 3-like [Hydractinia symbiolongicarpus]